MKKLIISLVMGLALMGAVFGAAAGLTIGGVDDVGSSTVDVVSPSATTTTVTDLDWTIDPSDINLVSAATVEITGDSGDEGNFCDVGISVTDGVDTVFAINVDVEIPATQWKVTTILDLSGSTIEAALLGTDAVTITLACDD